MFLPAESFTCSLNQSLINTVISKGLGRLFPDRTSNSDEPMFCFPSGDCFSYWEMFAPVRTDRHPNRWSAAPRWRNNTETLSNPSLQDKTEGGSADALVFLTPAVSLLRPTADQREETQPHWGLLQERMSPTGSDTNYCWDVADWWGVRCKKGGLSSHEPPCSWTTMENKLCRWFCGLWRWFGHARPSWGWTFPCCLVLHHRRDCVNVWPQCQISSKDTSALKGRVDVTRRWENETYSRSL